MYEGPEFQANGTVAHQQEIRFQDPDKLPETVENTLKLLDRELAVDEEYKEAFEIAHKLLKFYQEESKISNGKYYATAALYFGFRCKNAPYLLIEISEKIEHCSAISIGRCYLKLLEFVKGDSKNPKIEQLAQNLQYLDPSVYIPKYIRLCDFGSREIQVCIQDTAIKLLKRMTVDWMAQGRRPQSLCGAAILIAAKYHEVHISSSKICTLVQICDGTLKKRLNEFNQTNISQLTRVEFEQIENIESKPGNDPPAYKKIKKEEEKQKKALTDQEIKQLEEQTLQEALQFIDQQKVQPDLNEHQEREIPEILSSYSLEKNEEDPILDEMERIEKKTYFKSKYDDFFYEKYLKRKKQEEEQLKKDKNTNKKKRKNREKQKYQSPKEAVINEFQRFNINPNVVEKLFPTPEPDLSELLAEYKK